MADPAAFRRLILLLSEGRKMRTALAETGIRWPEVKNEPHVHRVLAAWKLGQEVRAAAKSDRKHRAAMRSGSIKAAMRAIRRDRRAE